jgi:hypothetical protein
MPKRSTFPVTTMNAPFGRSIEMFFKLCTRAPLMEMADLSKPERTGKVERLGMLAATLSPFATRGKTNT